MSLIILSSSSIFQLTVELEEVMTSGGTTLKKLGHKTENNRTDRQVREERCPGARLLFPE
jgi:hypothetical protein